MELIKLLPEEIPAVKEMIDLIKKGSMTGCPKWAFRNEDEDEGDCSICQKLFPKIIENSSCPCWTYSGKYLIKRLNELIKYSEEE